MSRVSPKIRVPVVQEPEDLGVRTAHVEHNGVIEAGPGEVADLDVGDAVVHPHERDTPAEGEGPGSGGGGAGGRGRGPGPGREATPEIPCAPLTGLGMTSFITWAWCCAASRGWMPPDGWLVGVRREGDEIVTEDGRRRGSRPRPRSPGPGLSAWVTSS